MKAIIMAGGKGSRLHPYTALLPKPLMPLGDMPVLELLLRSLSRAGAVEVFLAVNHLRHLIEAFFGDGSRIGLKLHYSIEDKPLGTAGPIAAVLDKLGDEFVLANGDLLTTIDVAAMIRFHRESRADVTVGVYPREVKIDFGLIEADADMRMTSYIEKPVYHHLVSMGIYVLNADRVRSYLKPGTYLDMPDLLRSITRDGGDVRCFRSDCFWLDIGRPDDFARAQELYEKDPGIFLGGSR
jgi:NDP-sugar pyrophosphorylase family protein